MTCLICIPGVIILVNCDVPLLLTESLIMHSIRYVRNDSKTGIQLFHLPKAEVQIGV